MNMPTSLAAVRQSIITCEACPRLRTYCERIGRDAQPLVYAAPVAAYGCNSCGWVRERLPDPEQQYYYVNQGPTYTGPGNLAPYPVYREGTISGYGYGYNRPYRAHRYYHRHHAARYYNGQRVMRRYY